MTESETVRGDIVVQRRWTNENMRQAQGTEHENGGIKEQRHGAETCATTRPSVNRRDGREYEDKEQHDEGRRKGHEDTRQREVIYDNVRDSCRIRAYTSYNPDRL